MDTYSQALQNYHEGKEPDSYEIVRDDGYSSIVPISIFFDDTHFSKIELLALDSCRGKVLDVGAGAGRHTLELQRRKIDVTAIDISQNAVTIMKNRGVKNLIHSDILDLTDIKFDTLLMLMNGIGMVGNSANLEMFLIKAKQILNKKGIIVFDSVDVSKTKNPKHVNYRKKNLQDSKLPGQQKLRIKYAGVTGDWFNWLHISFNELSECIQDNGFSAELIQTEKNGQYVAKLQKS